MIDGVSIMVALASGSAQVAALVPSSRIVAGILPKGTVLPAIAFEMISAVDRMTVAKESRTHVTERVQATVLAKTYPQAKAVWRALRTLSYTMPPDGDVSGIVVLVADPGPDFMIEESRIHGRTQDFRVSYSETR